VEDFVIVRNPDEQSSLPYLIRVPLPGRPVVLKARDTWPRTAKIYCHRAEEWPADAEVVERVPTRACQQRGASIDLVLDRSRENRSQLVFTRIKGREAISRVSSPRGQAGSYISSQPLSTSSCTPLTPRLVSRKSTAPAMSAIDASRPVGVRARLASTAAGLEAQ
jgi:hypothetical protein